MIRSLCYDARHDLSGDLHLPEAHWREKNVPLLLLIHGGGWCALDRHSVDGIVPFLLAQGFAVFNIEYRLTGEAPWPACGEDCLAAARYLLNSNDLPDFLDTKRLFILGGSAGGHLALMTGLRLPKTQVAAIVSISGITDLNLFQEENPELYHLRGPLVRPVSKEQNDKDSPTHYIRPDMPPVLLTHCPADTVVRSLHADVFLKKAKESGAQTELFSYVRPQDGHCIWIPGSNPHRLYPELEERIVRFLNRFR